MPRSTRDQSRATADRIVRTAQAMFAENGYAAVGLDDVASASGVTRGAVYNHFGSKRGLFEVALAHAQRQVSDAVSVAADHADDPWNGFLAGCRAFLVASLDDSVRRIMLVDAPAVVGWDTWRHGDAATSGRLLDEGLAELAEAGLVRREGLAETGVLLSGAMNAAALAIAASEHPDLALERSWARLELMIGALRDD